MARGAVPIPWRVVVVTLGVSLATVAACRAPLPEVERAWREARQEAVRAALPAASRATFAALRFFRHDPAYTLRAVLEPLAPPVPLTLAASDGRQRPALAVGRVRLRLPQGVAALTLYQLQDVERGGFFLPFRDAGAGRETYGAGRYVEVTPLAGGVVEIDFNRAYNPDCAYGIAGSCPLTPETNTLPFPVGAGEMAPAGH